MKKLVFIFGLIAGLNVYAAQTAKVVTDNARVLDKPQMDGAVVGSVPKDASIAVSNAPTNGFYKSRIPSGVVGWISGTDILVNGGAAPTEQTPKRSEKKKKEADGTVNDHTRIMLTGGMQMLSFGSFPTQIPTTGAGKGFGGTLEAQFKINEQFFWAGRAEYMTSSSTQTGTTVQTLVFHTIPVMGGLIFVPMVKPAFRWTVGGYAGMAMGTSLAVTQVSTLTSGTVTYSSSDLCFYLNTQGSYTLSSSFGVLGEVGYRMHSATYPASTKLPADAFKANFGGIVLRLGIEYRL